MTSPAVWLPSESRTIRFGASGGKSEAAISSALAMFVRSARPATKSALSTSVRPKGWSMRVVSPNVMSAKPSSGARSSAARSIHWRAARWVAGGTLAEVSSRKIVFTGPPASGNCRPATARTNSVTAMRRSVVASARVRRESCMTPCLATKTTNPHATGSMTRNQGCVK